MKQRFEDLLLQLKKDRKYQLIAIVIVVGFVYAVIQSNKPATNRRARTMAQSQAGAGLSNPDETVKDLTRALVDDTKRLNAENAALKSALSDTNKKIEENTERTSEIFKRILSRIEEDKKAGPTAVGGSGSSASPEDVNDPADPASGSGQISTLGSSDAPAIESFESVSQNLVTPPPPPPPHKIAIVGAGDHVRVKLIAGVNAATDGTPYPVTFKVISDVTGPNSSQLPVGEALIVAAAQGSLTDSRALFRLSQLNLAYPDGRRNVIDIDGWVVGEDGMAGMVGVLIDPIGKAIAGAGMAGFVQGIGQAMQAQNVTNYNNIYGGQTTEVTGDETQYAAGAGMSSAADTWARLIENRVNKLVPVVQVLSGREATAIFSRSFKIPDLIEAYQMDEDSYASAVD